MIELKEVKGLKELNDKLKQLPDKIANQYISKALAEEAKQVRDLAKANAPVAEKAHFLSLKKKGIISKTKGRGFLKKGIVYAKKTKATGSGIQPGFGNTVFQIGLSKAVWYGRLIEKGWIATGRKRKGMKIGEHRSLAKKFAGNQVMRHIPGRPFLRPAWDNMVPKILRDFPEGLKKYIEGMA